VPFLGGFLFLLVNPLDEDWQEVHVPDAKQGGLVDHRHCQCGDDGAILYEL
jgi:hypothetical protein